MTQNVIERPRQANNIPTVRERRETAPAPAAFRAQERFWEEVRRRIAERNPATRDTTERLY